MIAKFLRCCDFPIRRQSLPSTAILEFNEIEEENATRAQGSAMTARVVAADGSEIFSCDVGDEHSDAVIQLNSTNIERGGTVRLRSFRLGMP